MVEKDLASGLLVTLRLSPASATELPLPLPFSVAHLSSKVLGPTGRWLLQRLSAGPAANIRLPLRLRQYRPLFAPATRLILQQHPTMRDT